MIPHYAPCLNLNLPDSGRGQVKTTRAHSLNVMADKKDPAQGGVQGDEKTQIDNTHTQQRLTRTVNLSQGRYTIVLGKGGSCDPPHVNG
jgi:hypothetical protein